MASIDDLITAYEEEILKRVQVSTKEKFSEFTPTSLAQAARISGITPADITVLQIHLKKYYEPNQNN